MKKFIITLALACVAAFAAQAQTFPSRQITLIVPFPPGGSTDTAARIMAERMKPILGQPIIIENVGGAGGTVGSVRAARAAPDGYTLISGHMGTHAGAPFFYPNLGYDPQKDFEPVGLIAEQPELLTVRKEIPANNLTEHRDTPGCLPAKHAKNTKEERRTRFEFIL